MEYISCPLLLEDFRGTIVNGPLLNENAKCRKCNQLAADHPKGVAAGNL